MKLFLNEPPIGSPAGRCFQCQGQMRVSGIGTEEEPPNRRFVEARCDECGQVKSESLPDPTHKKRLLEKLKEQVRKRREGEDDELCE